MKIDDEMLERAVRAHGSTNPHERTYERMRNALEAALGRRYTDTPREERRHNIVVEVDGSQNRIVDTGEAPSGAGACASEEWECVKCYKPMGQRHIPCPYPDFNFRECPNRDVMRTEASTALRPSSNTSDIPITESMRKAGLEAASTDIYWNRSPDVSRVYEAMRKLEGK